LTWLWLFFGGFFGLNLRRCFNLHMFAPIETINASKYCYYKNNNENNYYRKFP
jgi:hypothetical protein